MYTAKEGSCKINYTGSWIEVRSLAEVASEKRTVNSFNSVQTNTSLINEADDLNFISTRPLNV